MSIVKLRRGNTVYVYESKSYRDPKTKQPRSIRKLLGKLDEATGTIVSTAKNPSMKNVVIQPVTPRITTPSSNPRNQYPATTTKKKRSSNEERLKASAGGERQAIMPSKMKKTGQASTAAHENTYRLQFSGKAFDKLQNTTMKGIHTMEVLDQFGISKEGRIIIKDKGGDVEVRIFNIERVKLNIQAKKLLDMLLMKISEQVPYGEDATRRALVDTFEVTITLDEFMALEGLCDRKNAREQFRAAGECIFSIFMTFDYDVWTGTGKRRKKTTKHFKANLFDSTVETRPIEKDIIIDSKIDFRFGIGLLEYLCSRYIMPVNIKIFTINPKTNPHAYTMARHLSEVYRIRMNKGQPPRISVRTLLETSCPELPSVEELKESGNWEYWQKIYEPVQRDLDALADTYGLVDWHYCHSNGEPLSDEELAHHNFEEWLDFMIEFTLPDYPDTTERRKKYLAQKKKRTAKS